MKSAAEKLGIAVNYSEDISHWSMVSYLDYRKKARPYKTFGKLKVRVISPEHWTIGKMGRYLEIDVRDVRKVLARQKLKLGTIISLWAEAFRQSPLSIEKGQFRDHVCHFLRNHGRKVWGRNFDPEKAVTRFLNEARIKQQ